MSKSSAVKYTSPTKQQQQQHAFKPGSPQVASIITQREALPRRIWIRRPEGVPTSLYVKEQHIVDDLKSMIVEKFPMTVARMCDPSDIIIRMEPSLTSISPSYFNSPTTPGSRKFLLPTSNTNTNNNGSVSNINSDSGISPSINSPLSPIPVSVKQSSLIPPKPPSNEFANLSMKSVSPVSQPLKADRNIWSILDQYYPSGMGLENAFIIDVPNQVYPQSGGNNSYQNRKSFSSETITEGKEEDFYSHSRRMNSLPTHTFSSRSTTPSAHRRSQSNPPDHASAVLLLPSSQGNKLDKRATDISMASSNDGLHSPERILSPNSIIPSSTTTSHLSNSSGSTEPTTATSGTPPISLNHEKPAVSARELESISNTVAAHQRQLNNINSTSKITTNGTSTMAKVLPSVNVLIVEDNLINLRILSAHLRRHRIHYDVAKNGQEAIDKWRKGAFHLVLMDIQLPVLSGLDASKEIRRLEKMNHIGVFSNSDLLNLPPKTPEDNLDLDKFRSPVIIVALTASNLKQDKQQALAAGCNDYLTKPVNLDWLLNKITEWGCMQALIDFDGWKSGERMTNISAALPSLTRKSSQRRVHSQNSQVTY